MCAQLRGTDVDVCVPSRHGWAPQGRGGLPAAGRTERLAGDRSPSLCTPQRLQLLRVGGGGTADPPPPNQPVSAEEPAGAPIRAVPVAGFGGSPATWFPLVWGLALQEWRVSWTPTLLSVPLLTAQHPQGVEPKHVGSEGGPGTSRVGGVGPSEWQAAGVQAPDCVAGACLSV